MKTIETSQRSEVDGKLRLTIPVEKCAHPYRVVVVITDVADEVPDAWPQGYLDSVIGQWQGEFDRGLSHHTRHDLGDSQHSGIQPDSRIAIG